MALLSTIGEGDHEVAEHGIERLAAARMQPVADFAGFEESSFARARTNADAIQCPQAEKRGHSEKAVWDVHEITAVDSDEGDFEALPKPLLYRDLPPHVRLPHTAGETSKIILKPVKTELSVVGAGREPVQIRLQLDVDEEASLSAV